MSQELTFQPLTPANWGDFETLFGAHGAYGGCWCMFWRIPRAQFSAQAGQANHAAMHSLVMNGTIPGILAYADGKAVGWCSIAPRTEFGPLERSRPLKRVDDQPVWSIVCFYIARGWRRKGLTLALIQAAIAHAAARGAHIVEAYPLDTAEDAAPVSSYMGLAGTFRRAGFVEVARNTQRRPILRYLIPPD